MAVLRCPLCKKPLVKSEPKCYETLTEHVCDPNGERPDRPTLICSNEDCELYGNTFWEFGGECFSDLPVDEYYDIKARCVDGLTDALNSHSREVEYRLAAQEVA